jgi:3D (Asp-Asp-Asp) domain-containing protein
MIGGYAVFSTSNYIVLEVEAEGVKSADVVVEDVAPTSYEGIPYMEREEPEDFTESVWKSIGTMEISSYSEKDSCHYPTKGGCLVASGKVAKVGMVATNLYPFGTRLMIDGEIYIVEDRISKRFNNRIDIFQGYGDEAYKNAKEFGIKHLDVKVLNN